MNFEKLALQDYYFSNCNTTYLQSALSYFFDNYKYEILFYLVDCKLSYTKELIVANPEVEKDPGINDDDPFHVQPVKLYNSNNEIVFNQKSFGDFLKFLKTTFNIRTKLFFNPLPKEFLRNSVLEGFKNNVLHLFNLDIYHCTYHDLYFNKKHNRHGLLIKAFDVEHNMVEVLDTYFTETRHLNFDNLVEGFNTTRFINTVIKIDGSNFENRLNYRERLDSLLTNTPAIVFIDDLCNDLESYLYDMTIDVQDKIFHLTRYNFALCYQLLPFLRMRFHLMSVNNLGAAVVQEMGTTIGLLKNFTDTMWLIIASYNSHPENSGKVLANHEREIRQTLEQVKILETHVIRDFGKKEKVVANTQIS